MNVICVSGKARHGKDTFAGYLSVILRAAGKSVLVTHYADLVKYVCKTFFDWNGEKDEAGRTLLQHVGTEMFRSMDPDYWVNFVCSVLRACPDKWEFVIVPDCRFPNEIECMRQCGFDTLHVSVQRSDFDNGLTADQASHSSENALASVEPDVVIFNDSTLDALADAASTFLCVNYGIDLTYKQASKTLPNFAQKFKVPVIPFSDVAAGHTYSSDRTTLIGTDALTDRVPLSQISDAVINFEDGSSITCPSGLLGVDSGITDINASLASSIFDIQQQVERIKDTLADSHVSVNLSQV